MHKKFKEALIAIKNGERDNTVGVCLNLFNIIGNNSDLTVAQFCNEAFFHIYGKNQCYPVEGSREEYNKYQDKYNSTNPYGVLRLELLDKMIQFCDTKHVYVLQYENDGSTVTEENTLLEVLNRRARELRSEIGFEYSIK